MFMPARPQSQRSRSLLVAAALCALSPALGQAQPAGAGAQLAGNCAACHGPDGHSPGAIPSIAATPAAEMVAAMQAFAAGSRPSTVMGRIARAFTDDEIAALAAYFATVK